MGTLLVASLAHLLTRREASGLACFIGLTAIWNVAFGTLPSNGLDVAFAVGLMLLPRGPRTGPAGDPWAPARRAEPVAARALP
jgi:hypothetical protein